MIENKIQLIECPRDAMQGIKPFIPTARKIRYIQSLLDMGFHTIDVGSFVSPKAIPQMADSLQVIESLHLSQTSSKLLTIVGNVRGALTAKEVKRVDYLGYPFSISENFQMRNTHKTIAQSEDILKQILQIAEEANKEVVVYLSMGFGNPYGDPWNVDVVANWVEKLSQMGVGIISLSDTIGSSVPKTIEYLFSHLIPLYPEITIGAHLHTNRNSWHEKVDAAFGAGCTRFDGAIKGFGGCPMARDELTGNMPTEKLISYFTQKKMNPIQGFRFESAYNEALNLFTEFH